MRCTPGKLQPGYSRAAASHLVVVMCQQDQAMQLLGSTVPRHNQLPALLLTFTSSTDTKLKLVPAHASPVASVALIGTNRALTSPRANGLDTVGKAVAPLTAAVGEAVPLPPEIAAAATSGRAAVVGDGLVAFMVEALKVGGLACRPDVAAG